jgi:hypothetical protein
MEVFVINREKERHRILYIGHHGYKHASLCAVLFKNNGVLLRHALHNGRMPWEPLENWQPIASSLSLALIFFKVSSRTFSRKIRFFGGEFRSRSVIVRFSLAITETTLLFREKCAALTDSSKKGYIKRKH